MCSFSSVVLLSLSLPPTHHYYTHTPNHAKMIMYIHTLVYIYTHILFYTPILAKSLEIVLFLPPFLKAGEVTASSKSSSLLIGISFNLSSRSGGETSCQSSDLSVSLFVCVERERFVCGYQEMLYLKI